MLNHDTEQKTLAEVKRACFILSWFLLVCICILRFLYPLIHFTQDYKTCRLSTECTNKSVYIRLCSPKVILLFEKKIQLLSLCAFYDTKLFTTIEIV